MSVFAIINDVLIVDVFENRESRRALRDVCALMRDGAHSVDAASERNLAKMHRISEYRTQPNVH